MSDSGLFSIVVPAHDVEAFLAECLHSIAGQTYRNLEVIVGTSSELVEAVRSVDVASSPYQERYDAFVARFCDLDDGKATSRVIERLLS